MLKNLFFKQIFAFLLRQWWNGRCYKLFWL
jgi:hypothetical protein